MNTNYMRFLRISAILLGAFLLIHPILHADEGRASGIAGTIMDQGDPEVNAAADALGYPSVLQAVPKPGAPAGGKPARPGASLFSSIASEVRSSAAAAAKSYSSWCDDFTSVAGVVGELAGDAIGAGWGALKSGAKDAAAFYMETQTSAWNDLQQFFRNKYLDAKEFANKRVKEVKRALQYMEYALGGKSPIYFDPKSGIGIIDLPEEPECPPESVGPPIQVEPWNLNDYFKKLKEADRIQRELNRERQRSSDFAQSAGAGRSRGSSGGGEC